jgi:hypothetical protein
MDTKRSEILKGVNFSTKINPALFKDNTGKVVEFPKRYAITKNDGTPLAIVGSEYKPQDHRENIMMVAKILDKVSPNYNVVHTMENARIYTDFRLMSDMVMANNQAEKAQIVVNVLNSYDGSASLKISLSVYRMICSNGMYGFANEFTLNKIHSKHLEVKGLVGGLRSAINDYKKAYIDFFNVLKDKNPLDGKVIMEALPEKLAKKAIAQYEADKLRSAWGQYNGFTNVITHSDISQNRKLVLHKKVAGFFEEQFKIA